MQLKGVRRLISGKDVWGFSLTELMVAIAIGSFIALAGTTFYVTTVGSSKDVYDAAARTEQIYSPAASLLDDIRRAGYRGTPAALSSYLLTTQGFGASAGDEGDFPAIEFGTSGAPTMSGATTTDCVLVSYVQQHTCAAGDGVAGCAGAGTVVQVHHRFGYRLRNHVLEATAGVHPGEYSGGAPVSGCTAPPATAPWVPVTRLGDVFVDTFTVELINENIADGDNDCVLGVAGAAPCDTYGNTSLQACGSTALSCRIDRLYKVTLCAYPKSIDNQCANDPDDKIYVELYAKPRNAVLIQAAAS
jgi:prepilin-type N-terminal cleavage/methylation domain-containing protein